MYEIRRQIWPVNRKNMACSVRGSCCCVVGGVWCVLYRFQTTRVWTWKDAIFEPVGGASDEDAAADTLRRFIYIFPLLELRVVFRSSASAVLLPNGFIWGSKIVTSLWVRRALGGGGLMLNLERFGRATTCRAAAHTLLGVRLECVNADQRNLCHGACFQVCSFNSFGSFIFIPVKIIELASLSIKYYIQFTLQGITMEHV